MTLYSPGGVNLADTTAPLILAFDDTGTTDVVFSVSASGDLTITPDGGDIALVANVDVSGVLTVTKATAGDAIVWTNSGGTPKTGYLYSDDTIVGLFNVAGAGAGRYGLRITPTSVVLEANAAETLTLTASGLTSSIQFRATPGSSGQPGVASSADTNTGLLWLGSDVLGIAADGALRIAIAPTTFAFRDNVVLGWDSTGDPSGGGIDTNFYRNSAGVLKTDGAFVAVSTVTASDFIGTIGADTPAAGAFTTGAFSGVLTVSDDIKLAATKRHYFDGGDNTYAVESSADVFDIVVGAATTLRVTPTGVVVTGTGSFSGAVTILGTVPLWVGPEGAASNRTNSKMTTGLTINQEAAGNEILSLKASDVAHGITTVTETDTYGLFGKASGASGGLVIRGFTEATTAASIIGSGTSDDTGKTTAARGYVEFAGSKKSGSTVGDVGADGNIVIIRNRDTTRFIFDAEAEIHCIGAQTSIYGPSANIGGTLAITGDVGFYGQAVTAKPTGVAVSDVAIHAALVTLNLIAA